jgi:RNA polymerase sigma-70 factor (ECF subfamily)
MEANSRWHPECYWPLLYVRARELLLGTRLRRRLDASDLVQETLARAYKALGTVRAATQAQFVKWLLQILHNLFMDEIRKRPEPGLEEWVQSSAAAWEESFADDQQSAPSEQLQRQELRLHIAQAMAQLPEDQCNVVIARDLLSMPVAEVAAVLERTPKSVAGLLLRGRRKLRQLLAAYQ